MLGISIDTPFSQWNWLDTLGERSEALALLSDRKLEAAKAFGVEPIEFGGGTYASRATFVIDKQGVLRYVNHAYDIKQDHAPLLELLSTLK